MTKKPTHEEKLAAIRNESDVWAYHCEVPLVLTINWNPGSWADWIDQHGVWYLKNRLKVEAIDYDPDLFNGSFKLGTLNASYDRITDIFGEPARYFEMQDGGKVDAEWYMRFEDGTLASIYNWKNGPAYLGKTGVPVQHITHWSVSGFNDTDALDLVTREVLEYMDVPESGTPIKVYNTLSDTWESYEYIKPYYSALGERPQQHYVQETGEEAWRKPSLVPTGHIDWFG